MDAGSNTPSPGPKLRGGSDGVHPHRVPKVRQRHGQVREVQEVRGQVHLRRQPRRVAPSPLQRIFSLIGTAIALIGQHPFGHEPGRPDFDQATGFGIQDESKAQALFTDFDLGTPGLDFPVRRPAPERRGGPQQQLRVGERKRLSGNINKAANIYEKEVGIYKQLPTATSRPPPTVDILELFAGEAKPSLMAPTCDLNACQPFDLVYGQDLKLPENQKVVLRALRRLRPWVLIVGDPCTDYNLFNENLNYSHRPEELQAKRDADQPLREFVMEVCLEQWDEGRLFVVENSSGSRLWCQTEFQKLAYLPGTTMTECPSWARMARRTQPQNLFASPSSYFPICRAFALLWQGNCLRRTCSTALLYRGRR